MTKTRNAAHPDHPAGPEMPSRPSTGTSGVSPVTILRWGSAGNDPYGNVTAAPRAGSSVRLSGYATAGSGSAPLSAFDMQRAARAFRSRWIGVSVALVLRMVGAHARRALARYRRFQEVRAMHNELRQLNDHTLRDLGLHRSESMRVPLEMTAEGEYARAHVRSTTQNARP